MASLQNRADGHLRRLDRKAGFGATYEVYGGSTLNVVTGKMVPTFTSVPNVRVRPYPLSIREKVRIAEAGLVDVDAAWKIRKFYVDEPKPDDAFTLSVSGFRYYIVPGGVSLDRLQADWTLYTKRSVS